VVGGLGFLGGIVLWAIYMGLIATQVRDNRFNPRHVFKRLPSVIIQIVALIVALVVLLAIFLFLLVILLTMLSILGLDVVSNSDKIDAIIITLLYLMAIPAAFTVHGIFLNERNFIAALWDSMRVVQWNISSTYGLFLLILIINTAMQYIWTQVDPGSWLTLLAITVNAFITTGLIAATFVYFKDRYRYWREIREALLAELERRRTQQDSNRQA